MSFSEYHEDDSTIRDISNIPDFKSELDDAKTFLQRVSPFSGDNLYDHLSEALNKILAERPENVIDFFEEYSRKVKEQRYKPLTDHLKDIYISPLRFDFTTKIMPFLQPKKLLEAEPSTADPEDEEVIDPEKFNMMSFLFHYEKAGIGLPKTELYVLELSMKKLIKEQPISDIRFWGKIYGMFKNYIVVETILKEEEILKRNTPPEDDENEGNLEPPPNELNDALAEVEKQQEMDGEGVEAPKSKIPRPLPPLPLSQFEPMPETPVEVYGEGVNKKTYFVCNEVGDPWIELPNVTPKEIVAARQIVKTFTGNLDNEVVSYPIFPGTEKNYLRAQIARISAATQISPLGFYSFKGDGGEGEEEEEEDEEEEDDKGFKTSYKINKRYEPHPMADLTDPLMSFWVHHTLNILPQGRVQWWNPYPRPDMGEEEMAEEEEEEPFNYGPIMEPETGPLLLTSLSEDASLEAVPPWSVRCTSTLFPEHSMALVRSNLWPGAYAFSIGKFFENIYLGTGHKFYASNFSPTPLPYIEEEYPLGPEIMEIADPSAAEEEAWRIAHEPKPVEPKEDVEEEGEEEEEEDDDDDDDD